MNNLLPILVLLPILGGVALLLGRRGALTDSAGESFANLTGLLSLGLSIFLVVSVLRWTPDVSDAKQRATADATMPGGAATVPADNASMPADTTMPANAATIVPRLEFAPEWFRIRLPATATLTDGGWQLRLGLDGIGAIMVLLTTLVTSCVIVIAQTTVERRRAEFCAWLLIASGCMMLVFVSMDLLLFYIGFELVLIPLFVLIAGWGERDATGAAKRFVLYTLAGSIPMILALLGISLMYKYESPTVWQIGFSELSQRAAEFAPTADKLGMQTWIFGFLLLGLGIKTAILPLHTWLPTTYGAAHPTSSPF